MAEVRQLHPVDATAQGSIVAVARAVLDGLDDLVPVMGDAYRREVAEYAALDAEAFDAVLVTSADLIRRFVAPLVDGVGLPAPDRARLVAAGRRRQQSGISLDAAMHAFRIASRVGWTGIADAAAAIDPTTVGDLAGRWLEYSDRASTAFAEGHTSASSEELRRLDHRRRALVSDLLAAPDAGAARSVALAHGLRLAARYVPLLLVEGDGTEQRIEALVPVGAIVGPRGGNLVALVPAPLPATSAEAIAAGGLVARGVDAAPGGELAASVQAAERMLDVAARLGRTSLVGVSDLVLHRAVGEHDDLRDHLQTQVLDALVAADPDGIFRMTLRAYLEVGAIRAVADDLFVHANTVTYRLRRVREITGLDPRIPNHAARLVLALALHELDPS